MARLETRTFGPAEKPQTQLLIFPETEEESKIIDTTISDKLPATVVGQVILSDGYGEHYIRLEKFKYGDIKLDDFILFDRALSADEVLNIYNKGIKETEWLPPNSRF